MLASAAPISVPATPKNDSSTAEDTAASALAATWTGLRPMPRGLASISSIVAVVVVLVVGVRGEVMGSGGSGRTGEAAPPRVGGSGGPRRGISTLSGALTCGDPPV
jgi:hypothetical protein